MELHLSEAIVQIHAQSPFNPSEDAMSKKIKLQDLSISKFDQPVEVEGIKGGSIFQCFYKTWCGYHGSYFECRKVIAYCRRIT